MRKISKMLVGILLISILSLSIKNMTLAAGITYYRYKSFVYTDDDGLCYGGVTITDYKGKKKK